VFGTTRTLSESLLDIGEGIIAILVAAALTYIVGRWVWPITSEWWEQRSSRSAAKAAAALDSQIRVLNESKTDLFLRQTMLSGAAYYSLRLLIEFFGWMTFAWILILMVGLEVGPFGGFPGRWVARIGEIILGGMALNRLFRWRFQRPQVEELVKLDELLIKLERRHERLRIRAGAQLD
jgi:hypothetical protein